MRAGNDGSPEEGLRMWHQPTFPRHPAPPKAISKETGPHRASGPGHASTPEGGSVGYQAGTLDPS